VEFLRAANKWSEFRPQIEYFPSLWYSLNHICQTNIAESIERYRQTLELCICFAAAMTTANLIFIFVRFAICRFYDPNIGHVKAARPAATKLEIQKQHKSAKLDIRTICT